MITIQTIRVDNLTNGTMVPEQYFASRPYFTGEKHLLLAMLIDAISCCSGRGVPSNNAEKYRNSHVQEAWNWILSDERSRPGDLYYDYLSVCEILSIDHRRLREDLQNGKTVDLFLSGFLRKVQHGQGAFTKANAE